MYLVNYLWPFFFYSLSSSRAAIVFYRRYWSSTAVTKGNATTARSSVFSASWCRDPTRDKLTSEYVELRYTLANSNSIQLESPQVSKATRYAKRILKNTRNVFRKNLEHMANERVYFKWNTLTQWMKNCTDWNWNRITVQFSSFPFRSVYFYQLSIRTPRWWKKKILVVL